MGEYLPVVLQKINDHYFYILSSNDVQCSLVYRSLYALKIICDGWNLQSSELYILQLL